MKAVMLPVSVEEDGKTWNLYGFKWQTPDGEFGSYLHALSHDHAAMMLAEMRETAVMDGQIMEVL